jgi:hypothetical protein
MSNQRFDGAEFVFCAKTENADNAKNKNAIPAKRRDRRRDRIAVMIEKLFIRYFPNVIRELTEFPNRISFWRAFVSGGEC